MPPSTLLASGFGLDTDLIPDGEHTCGICGEYGEALHMKRVTKANTADIADTFRHSNHVCPACAACFAESRLLTSNLYADSTGSACKPMVALSSATDERPAWRDLVRRLAPGTETVAVFTSNTKRRLWPLAVVSTVGPAWRVLFVDGETERVLTVDYQNLLTVLGILESLLDDGFTKQAIATNLLTAFKLIHANDLTRIIERERTVAALRGTDEFALALFIAQKDQ